MTKTGTLVRWDDARGFGFIRSPQSSADVFVHVRDFRGTLPAAGMAVFFEEIHVGGKGPRAMAVRAAGAAELSRAGTARTSVRRQDGAKPNRQRSQQGPEFEAVVAFSLMVAYAG